MFWMIFGLISFTALFFTGLLMLGTGVGKDAIKRYKNKKLFRQGNYTNALIFTKDGLLKEVFARNVDGKFRFGDQPYVRVPKLNFPYKGIPTGVYIEGTPTQVDIFGLDDDRIMSCNEMDKVMYQNMNFDFKEWFAKNSVYLLIAGVVLIALLAANLFFGYTMFEWIRDSAPVIKDGVEVVKSNIA